MIYDATISTSVTVYFDAIRVNHNVNYALNFLLVISSLGKGHCPPGDYSFIM